MTDFLSTLQHFVRAHLDYVTLGILSLICGIVLAVNSGLPIGGDVLFVFNSGFVGRYIDSWNQWIDVGSNVPYVIAGPPLGESLILSALMAFGLSVAQSIWVFFTAMTFIGAAGCCYLLHVIFPRTKASALPGFISGFTFIYNPLYVVDTYKSLFSGLAERAVFPLAIGLFIDGLTRKDFRFSLGFSLSSLLILGRFPVLQTRYGYGIIASLLVISLARVAFTKPASRRPEIRFLLRYLTLTLVFVVAVNAYLISPLLALKNTFAATLTSYDLNFFYNSWSTFANSVRLVGSWPLYNGYVPYGSSYTGNLGVSIATLGLPISAFACIILQRGRRSLVLGLVAAALVILSMGTNPPLGFLYAAIVGASLLKVFYISDAFQPFLLFAYCVMIGATVAGLMLVRRASLGSLRVRVCVLVLIGLVLTSAVIGAWPLVTGDVMTNYNAPTQRGATIPREYSDAAHWLDSQTGSSRVLVTHAPGLYVSTDWGFQGAVQFYQMFFPSAIVTGTGTQYSTSSQLLQDVYDVYHYYSYQRPVESIGNWNSTSLTSSPWNVSPPDAMTVENDPTSPEPYLVWTINAPSRPTDETFIRLPQTMNWNAYDALVLSMGGSFDPASLSIGIRDVNDYVGWYKLSSNVRSQNSGWSELFLPLATPDESGFDKTSVASIYLMYDGGPARSASVSIKDIHLANISFDSIGWAKTLGLLAVGYVVTDKSLVQGNWTFPIVNNSSAFNKVYNAGPLTVYTNRFASSLIYAPSNLTIASSAKEITKLASSEAFSPNSTAFVDSQSIAELRMQQFTRPDIDVKFQSPTFYTLHIVASGPFILINSESFDAGWTACTSQSTCFVHFTVNSFANAWYVTSPGSYDISIRFLGQTNYQIGIGISAGILLWGISYLVGSIALSHLRVRRVGRRSNDYAENSGQTEARPGLKPLKDF